MTRDEAIKIINCYDIGFYDLSGEKIPVGKLVEAFDMAIEALQAEPVKHGKWEKNEPLPSEWQYKCSKCGVPSKSNSHNFCPNCGCAMTKEKEK